MRETHESLNESVSELYDLSGKRDALAQEREALLGRLAGVETDLTALETRIEQLNTDVMDRYGLYVPPRMIKEQIEAQSSRLPLEAHPNYFKAFFILNIERNEDINQHLRTDLPRARTLEVHPRRLILGDIQLETDEREDRFILNMLLNNRLGINRQQITRNTIFRSATGGHRISESSAREKYGKALMRLKQQPLWDAMIMKSKGQTHKKFYFIRHDIVIRPVPGAISYGE